MVSINVFKHDIQLRIVCGLVEEQMRGNRIIKFNEQRYEKYVTGSMRGVLINQGATQLDLMLSFAHSHARFFISWFSAPARKFKEKKLGHEINCNLQKSTVQFHKSIDSEIEKNVISC